MKPWFKVGEDIIDCIKTDHQFTIDNEWVNSHFTIDIKYNNTYFNIIFDLYNNKRTFDWEDNKSKGFISTIKSIDVTDNIITCQVKSKKWRIKDKSDERDKRIDEILNEKNL
jgi:hypothetical protein